MAVIKTQERKVEIKKELVFTADTITEELAKKYNMNNDETLAEWVESYFVKDSDGNDVGEDLGTCLILRGVSTPRKKAAPVAAE